MVARVVPAQGGNASEAAVPALPIGGGALLGIGLMTALINVLYLTGSFYMLEVYDRVIPSRSVPTLIGLSVLAFALYGFQAVLDLLRSRVLVRVGAALDAVLAGRVFAALARMPLVGRPAGDGMQPLRDLDAVRGFLSGPGPGALFDLPWIPLYLGICFAFHPAIGTVAFCGALMLVGLTILTELRTRGPARQTVSLGQNRNVLADASRRNAEVLHAMGMAGRFGALWSDANDRYMLSQQRTADVAGGLGGLSRVVRLALQSGVLGLGAYLVIGGQATSGIIIASSILVSRALAPVELTIANWKGFVGARQSWARLRDLLAALPPRPERLLLPPPAASLSVEALSAGPPGAQRLVIQDVSFAVEAGGGVGVIGPSASGKSSLARALVGVWPALRGKVRLDGAGLDGWNPEELGRHLGYLPQDVELFAGSVAENIGRFDPDADPGAVIKAGRAAGIHDMVLRLPEGYDTPIGERGGLLSAGQRQRVALARALYGDPFLVVLDEPNSNLDSDGERALTEAVLGVRARGGVVVVVAHRPSALAGVDLVLVMNEGRVQGFGPRDETVARLARPVRPVGPAPDASSAPAAGVPAPPAGAPVPFRVVGEWQGRAS